MATALDVLKQDPLTQALQNASQPLPQPAIPYDLNNIGQYFQYQPLGTPEQTQPMRTPVQASMQVPTQQAQPARQYRSLEQLYANTPAEQQGNKIVYRGKVYSANNPVLNQFPRSMHFKPTPELLRQAQEWENQEIITQAATERQHQMDTASSFLITPEFINNLPENSMYRNVLQAGQRMPFSQLQNIQKASEAASAQQEIQQMLPTVEAAYASIPDDNPYKPMIQFALQGAIQSGDPKQLNYAYGLIGKLATYITPKAQTKAQKDIDAAKGEKLEAETGFVGARTTGQKIKNQYMPQTLQAGIDQKEAGANVNNIRASLLPGQTAASNTQKYASAALSDVRRKHVEDSNNGSGSPLTKDEAAFIKRIDKDYADYCKAQGSRKKLQKLEWVRQSPVYKNQMRKYMYLASNKNPMYLDKSRSTYGLLTNKNQDDIDADKYLVKNGKGSLTKAIDKAIRDKNVDVRTVQALLRRYKNGTIKLKDWLDGKR
jgi:hypothetical protein